MWAQIGNWLYQNAMAIFISVIASLLISKRYYDKAIRAKNVCIQPLCFGHIFSSFLVSIYLSLILKKKDRGYFADWGFETLSLFVY